MQIHDEVVGIKVREGQIAGTLIAPSRRVPGVLLAHGWGGSRQQYQQMVRAVAPLRCVCLTFDFSGHVATASQRESVTREDNLADIVAAYDFLAAHPLVDPTAIAVVGSSYGGYLASILTSLRPVRWLALRAPALYKDSDWQLPKHQLQREQSLIGYRQQRIAPEDNRALAACAAFRGDVLLVESEHDKIVPHPVLGNYRNACIDALSVTYRKILLADHALSDERSRSSYISILVHWLEEMMLGARGHLRSKTSMVPDSAGPVHSSSRPKPGA
jgi:pimeloyl-ACP methyl ester carboxylesterase